MSPSPKPLVQVACVCEKVLIEADNVPSLIRIVDTYTLHVPPGDPQPRRRRVNLTAFISLKSGEVTGEYEVGLRLKEPEGKVQPGRSWNVVLNGGEHGANLQIAFAIANPKLGLYWFDVLWGDDVLTSIPFRLRQTESIADVAEPNETETS